MSRKILMEIPRMGISTGKRSVTVTTEGFQGTGCKDATAALKKALGAVQTEQLSAEYFEEPQARHEFVSE